MTSEFRSHWTVLLLLPAMFILTGILIPTFPFGSDEGDNILGAQAILSGGDIYGTFYSQHMPFGYYFTALLALCGAKSVLGFRIAYVVFLALFWVWLYWFYSRRVPCIMLLFLLIAFPLSAPYFLGHVILADNLSGFALLVLMLELISHRDLPGLTPGRIAVISLASFTAIASSFLSVYPVFVFFIGLALFDLQQCQWRSADFPFRRYILLTAAFVFPFALLTGWYALSGNLGDFYDQAYEFNRTIYAKYVYTGGRHEPLLKFVLMPLVWIQHGVMAMKTAVQNLTLSFDLLLVLGNLAFIIFIRRGWVFSVILFFFLAYTGTRSFGGFGYTGFHSAPYFIVSLASLGWLIAALSQPRNIRILGAACLLLVFLKLTVPAYLRVTMPVYWQHVRHDPSLLKLGGKAATFWIPDQVGNDKYTCPSCHSRESGNPVLLLKSLNVNFATPYDAEIRKLTEPGDMIWSAGVDGYVYINNQCLPAGRIWGLVPWYAEKYSQTIIADLEQHKPKLIIFPSDGEVWGHALKDFGAVIYQYIQKHYCPLDKNAPVKKDIYIRN